MQYDQEQDAAGAPDVHLYGGRNGRVQARVEIALKCPLQQVRSQAGGRAMDQWQDTLMATVDDQVGDIASRR